MREKELNGCSCYQKKHNWQNEHSALILIFFRKCKCCFCQIENRTQIYKNIHSKKRTSYISVICIYMENKTQWNGAYHEKKVTQLTEKTSPYILFFIN